MEVDGVSYVALRKESVDRNNPASLFDLPGCVALRKESVDRNPLFLLNSQSLSMSLSARRAWIEIAQRRGPSAGVCRRSPQGERG